MVIVSWLVLKLSEGVINAGLAPFSGQLRRHIGENVPDVLRYGEEDSVRRSFLKTFLVVVYGFNISAERFFDILPTPKGGGF